MRCLYAIKEKIVCLLNQRQSAKKLLRLGNRRKHLLFKMLHRTHLCCDLRNWNCIWSTKLNFMFYIFTHQEYSQMMINRQGAFGCVCVSVVGLCTCMHACCWLVRFCREPSVFSFSLRVWLKIQVFSVCVCVCECVVIKRKRKRHRLLVLWHQKEGIGLARWNGRGACPQRPAIMGLCHNVPMAFHVELKKMGVNLFRFIPAGLACFSLLGLLACLLASFTRISMYPTRGSSQLFCVLEVA